MFDADNVPEPWLAFADEEVTFVLAPVGIGEHVDEKHEELAFSMCDVDANGVMFANNETDTVETPALDRAVDEPPAAIAGVPPVNYHTPRPRRRLR